MGVTSVQPRTVVVLENGSALAMAAWIDGAAAVLEAWLAGQAAGGAIADVLVGKVNPSGRLAETFPLRIEDTPAFLNFPGDADEVRYAEGIFVGYRWYDKRRQPVQFPFGHGLSYTTFDYGPLEVSARRVQEVDGLTLSVAVTNTGRRAGSEVVQVYVRDVDASVSRPEKELKGFAKVHLAPTETRTVTVHLNARAFAFWHAGHHRWVVENGDFEILVGSSSADIRASCSGDRRGGQPARTTADRHVATLRLAPRPTGSSPRQRGVVRGRATVGSHIRKRPDRQRRRARRSLQRLLHGDAAA